MADSSKHREVPVWCPLAVGLAAFLVTISIDLAVRSLLGVAGIAPTAVWWFGDVSQVILEGLLILGACVALWRSTGALSVGDLGLRRIAVDVAVFWAVLVVFGDLVVEVTFGAVFGPGHQDLGLGNHGLAWLPLEALTACVVAPLAEEIFFRGFMQSVLARRAKPGGAAIIVAVVFALLHTPGANWQTVVTLLPFAIWLGFLAWRLKSVIPGIAAHTVLNAMALGTLYGLPSWGRLGLCAATLAITVALSTWIAERRAGTASRSIEQ